MEFRMTFIISLLFVEILELIICTKIQSEEMVQEGIPEISAGDKNTSESLEEFWNQLISESSWGVEINYPHTSREVPCVEKSNMPRTRSPSENPLFSTSANEEIIEIASNYEGTLGEKLPSDGYYCDDCHVHFRFARVYEGHFREKHPDKKPYLCSHCNASYSTKRFYEQHTLRFHTDETDFVPFRYLQKLTCHVCDTEHIGKKALQQHCLMVHRGMKTFKCEDCEARFSRNYDLKYHKRNNHSYPDASDAFRCKCCKICFQRSDDLEDHQIVCKEIRGNEATENNSQSDLLSVKNSDEGQICKTCGLKLQSLVQLRRHNRENHPKIKGIFPCDKCKKTFASNSILDIHLSKYHRNPEEIVQKKYRIRTNMKYECHVCREEINYLKQYMEHFKTRHPDEKPFICGICRGGYSSKSGLTEHIHRTHEPENFPCSYCTKFFPSKKDFRRHEKACGKREEIINQKKSFFCHICVKWLHGSSKGHKLYHRYYDYCEFCEKRFHKENNSQGLLMHVAKRHPYFSGIGVKYSSNEQGMQKNLSICTLSDDF